MRKSFYHVVKFILIRVATAICIVLQIAAGLLSASTAFARDSSSIPAVNKSPVRTTPVVIVNRTLPKVDPARTGLQLPANPRSADFIASARVFEDPVVPVGGEPSSIENGDLGRALENYSKRLGPDDFSALTAFLDRHPKSFWNASLLTELGLEYYNTAHYSLALDAWTKAWALAKDSTEVNGKIVADRAGGELAHMYARIGEMDKLAAFLNSVGGRAFGGPATEKIASARAGLWSMQNRSEISFKCGPLALHSIMRSLDHAHVQTSTIYEAASTTNGFSLTQVAELSKKVGLNYQIAFRQKDAEVVIPSVIHWKVGHYAAIVREQDDRFLVQDPTFRNDVWLTKAALDSEASGYFAVPAGTLKSGWRAVRPDEGNTVWGKGNVGGPDPGGGGGPPGNTNNCSGSSGSGAGMAVSSVDLLLVSLNLTDQPVGYTPPVGLPVQFTLHYNQREMFQPSIFNYSNLGAKWTFDWSAYIQDNPFSTNANVQYYRQGGFARYFTGFNPANQTFAFQQYDQTKLVRTSGTSYELDSADGSKLIFGQSDGSTGTTRKVFLTQMVDPYGNAVGLTYDASLRLVAVSDAIGQVTTLAYENPADYYKITKVTDPFGRSATFDYDAYGRLVKSTDVIGITSQFVYSTNSEFINALITPYGTTAFTAGGSGTTRSLETLYPDGNRERVEFNESTALGIPESEPAALVPSGMATHNDFIYYRNTYFWSKIACAAAYGDYTKARIYHWLHTPDLASAARGIESIKEPLESRVWNDYLGQTDPIIIGTNTQPSHTGRVLDDGNTQLYSYQYDGFGHVIQRVDPVGRTFSYIYSTNGIDLLEVRQTRAGNNELLQQYTYNAQHLPLTSKDASGQVTTYTYNARGQKLTVTDPSGGISSYAYDTNGYRLSLDGPLLGSGDTTSWTYDSYGRVHTKTDESGYVLTFDYDALDHLTQIIHPDATYESYTYTLLDATQLRNRAGRITSLEFNSVRQLDKRTDPLGRVTLFQWCKCGDSKSITDPMGRTTTWNHDVEGRITGKDYADGSSISYLYENNTKRMRQRVDEKSQITQYTYFADNSLATTTYPNAIVPTPSVTLVYDPNYPRLTAMTDGIGTTRYSYNPITTVPTLGAGNLATQQGPLTNETIAFQYDANGIKTNTTINGIASTIALDLARRVIGVTNGLGSFVYTYDGYSTRLASQTAPNGLVAQMTYGGNLQDNLLQQVSYTSGNAAVSQFAYTRDIAAGRITSWSQQAGTQTPLVYNFNYDSVNQLTAATFSQPGITNGSYQYSYDPAGNRLMENLGATTNLAAYNALNELTTFAGSSTTVTNQWDAEQRLVSTTMGSTSTQFSYDGTGRLSGIRVLTNNAEASNLRYLWSGSQICEERDSAGTTTKRFYAQGMQVVSKPNAGNYYYTRDHLGSVRELTDSSGNVRIRNAYDPFGRMTRVIGNFDASFGLAGMFYIPSAGINLTWHRAYDPNVARWLSQDMLPDAEIQEGPNLYTYVLNNPINGIDTLGLCCEDEKNKVTSDQYHLDILNQQFKRKFGFGLFAVGGGGLVGGPIGGGLAIVAWYAAMLDALDSIDEADNQLNVDTALLHICLEKGCKNPCSK